MFSIPGSMPMAVVVLLCLLGMSFLLILALVVYVSAPWKRGSVATPKARPSPSTETTPLSVTEARVAQMEADQAALFSTLEKLTTTIKRLSSRAGMRDIRERRDLEDQDAPPPVGTPKPELLRYYGMSGKAGPDFARAQQQYEARKKETN